MRKSRFAFALGLCVLFAAHTAEAQRRITGKITSSTGEPVSAAQIQLQGTTLSTIASDDGSYALRIPDGAQTLVVRRIGYKRVLAPVTATASTVDVVMTKDVLQLDMMVVTGTTTTVSSANAANATVQISGADLTRAPAPTIENAFQGKIPGAVISTNSGAPGGGSQIQLRGITSINGSSSPLYVVDGVLVSNNAFGTGLNSITNAGAGISANQDQQANRIADLNPEDIENVEVLKGASAGAIYGSKASNGVILITTKRGLSGKPQFRLSQSFGQSQLSKKLGLRCFKSAAEAQSWWEDVVGGTTLPVPWQPECNDFEEQMYGGNKPSYQTDLSVAGGNNATTYYIGGSVKRDNAIMRNTGFGRQTLRANVSQLLGERLNVRVNNEYIHSTTERGVSGNDNAPSISPGNIFSGTPTWVNLAAKVNGQYQPNLFYPEQTNPFQNAELLQNAENVNRYVGGINTTLSAYSSPRQTLDFTLIGGIDVLWDQSRLVAPPTLFYENADGLPGTIVTNRVSDQNLNLNLSGAHRYTRDAFTATTSFGTRSERRETDQIFNQGRSVPFGVTDIQFGVQQQLNEAQTLIKDQSYYAQEELLLFKERMLLTAAINAERSSVNGDDKLYYKYPKFAASYRLPWLPKFADDLKVRLAWGQAGNQPPYGYKYTTLPTGVYGGITGARPSTISGNPNIKPETSTELEGGFDLTAFSGRVAFSATMFDKRVDDLVLATAVAPSTGFTTQFANAGALKNTGTELTLSITPIQTKSLQWVSRTTYATVSNKVTRLDVPCFNGGAFFSLRFGAPYVCGGESISTLQVNNGWDTTFVDGAFSRRTRHLQNYESAPKFTMGFSNEITWKALRLYALLDVRKGGYAVDLTGLYYDPVQTLADTLMSQERFGRFNQGYAAYVEPAGFVKLRELSLGYSLRGNLVKRLFNGAAKDARIELSGRNLMTWTKYKGYDPEVSNYGNQNIGRFQDVVPYPPSRSFFFSVITTF